MIYHNEQFGCGGYKKDNKENLDWGQYYNKYWEWFWYDAFNKKEAIKKGKKIAKQKKLYLAKLINVKKMEYIY